jgi:hypothetical protein
MKTFKILSFSFLKYTVYYHYLQSPYYPIEHQNLFLQSNSDLVLINQPYSIILSSFSPWLLASTSLLSTFMQSTF